MIVLRNYFDIDKKIVLYNNIYKIEDSDACINGVGGIQDNVLYGLYVQDGELFFVEEMKSYEINIHDFNCSNQYINTTERVLKIVSTGKELYDICYKPLIDPGMMYYDIDEEEYDILLYISNLLKDEDVIRKFVLAMNQE